jgi:hypothetical protein
MTAHTLEFTLGVEELTAAISLAGQVEAAKGLLVGTFGELSADEQKGRLMAANHALLARGWVTLVEGKPRLDERLAGLITRLFTGGDVLRSGRTGAYGENVLALFPGQGGWLEHRVRDGVVHSLRFPLNKQQASAALEGFFQPVFGGEQALQVDLPDGLLSDLDPVQRRSFDAALAYIRQASPDNLDAYLLAEDLARGPWRGSTLRLQVIEDGMRTRGALWVQGQGRLWQLQAQEGRPGFQARLCQKKAFQDFLEEILK